MGHITYDDLCKKIDNIEVCNGLVRVREGRKMIILGNMVADKVVLSPEGESRIKAVNGKSSLPKSSKSQRSSKKSAEGIDTSLLDGLE